MMQATDHTSIACVYSVKDSMTSGARYQRVATYLLVRRSAGGQQGEQPHEESGVVRRVKVAVFCQQRLPREELAKEGRAVGEPWPALTGQGGHASNDTSR